MAAPATKPKKPGVTDDQTGKDLIALLLEVVPSFQVGSAHHTKLMISIQRLMVMDEEMEDWNYLTVVKKWQNTIWKRPED